MPHSLNSVLLSLSLCPTTTCRRSTFKSCCRPLYLLSVQHERPQIRTMPQSSLSVSKNPILVVPSTLPPSLHTIPVHLTHSPVQSPHICIFRNLIAFSPLSLCFSFLVFCSIPTPLSPSIDLPSLLQVAGRLSSFFCFAVFDPPTSTNPQRFAKNAPRHRFFCVPYRTYSDRSNPSCDLVHVYV